MWRQNSILKSGWELQSIQIGKLTKLPKGSERYYFKDDGTFLVSSISSDVDFRYQTHYGLVNISGKWLLVIEDPLNDISLGEDTIVNYRVQEIKQPDDGTLSLKFLSKVQCNDSSSTSECATYRIHYFTRLKWSPDSLNDTIPM